MNSGWAAKLGTDEFRGADAARGGSLHFPGFHIEATQMLLEQNEREGWRSRSTPCRSTTGRSPDFSPPITHGCRLAATGSSASRGST